MTYLAHTAHAQLGGLVLSFLGWTLTAAAPGLIQWRVWLVPDSTAVPSGVAWVGVWRSCRGSRAGRELLSCGAMGLLEDFVPPEIAAAQVLTPLSLLTGLCGVAAGVRAMRDAYFGAEGVAPVRRGFLAAGLLCLGSAASSLVPLLWNASAVLTNRTIAFPAGFGLPPAPRAQRVGCGIGVGVAGAALTLAAGIIFCSYRATRRIQSAARESERSPHPRLHQSGGTVSSEGWDLCLDQSWGTVSSKGRDLCLDQSGGIISSRGRDNPAFEFQERF